MPLPEYVFKDVTHITADFLHQRGIKALVLDVDNTLTSHGGQQLEPDVARWLAQMQQAGFHLMLASNNTKKRVAPFAEKLGIPYASMCCKPLPRWLWAAQRLWGFEKAEIALVGDQIFTDALGGFLSGVTVLLVRPRYRDIKAGIRFRRKLEAPLLLRYYKRGGRLL